MIEPKAIPPVVEAQLEPKAIPPVVEAQLFSMTIISFLSFIFSVKKLISLSDWLSPGATLESALRRPKLNSSLPHIHIYSSSKCTVVDL